MKKIYQTPNLQVIHILTERLVAESSFDVDPNTPVDEVYVKEDFSFRDRSNVWDDWDDWDD